MLLIFLSSTAKQSLRNVHFVCILLFTLTALNCTNAQYQPGSPWPKDGQNNQRRSNYIGPQGPGIYTKWSYAFGLSEYSLAIGSDGTVYLAQSGNLTSINHSTGSVIWTASVQVAFSTYSPTISANGILYSGSVAINTTNGATVYSIPFTSDSTAIGTDGTVYGTVNHYIFALDGNSGAQKWNYSYNNISASPAR